MYADRVETANKLSIKQRLDGDSAHDSGQRPRVAGKRQRQEDGKWEHDLYNDIKPQISNRKVGAQDLRLKLQRKSFKPTPQSRKGPISGGVRDLREILSGTTQSQLANNNTFKSNVVPKASIPARKVAVAEPSVPETKRVANPTSKRKSQAKGDASIDGFLRSQGLEKYLITFQAEEVDMTTLVHMTDGDLKALGIPMGPRKKILLALDARG